MDTKRRSNLEKKKSHIDFMGKWKFLFVFVFSFLCHTVFSILPLDDMSHIFVCAKDEELSFARSCSFFLSFLLSSFRIHHLTHHYYDTSSRKRGKTDRRTYAHSGRHTHTQADGRTYARTCGQSNRKLDQDKNYTK